MGIISTGLNMCLILNLTEKAHIDVRGVIHTGSMFLKSGDNNDATFVSLFDLSKIKTSIQFRYKISPKIMLSAGYKFQYLHNYKYDDLAIASDNFLISLSLIL